MKVSVAITQWLLDLLLMIIVLLLALVACEVLRKRTDDDLAVTTSKMCLVITIIHQIFVDGLHLRASVQLGHLSKLC